tara:strand:- start:24987 stop:26042 length:1056 start_codon:yes stop_codon:yes gene_type:complete
MSLYNVPYAAAIRSDGDFAVDGKVYQTKVGENGVRRLNDTGKYSDADTVSYNHIPRDEYIDRRLNSNSSVCSIIDSLESQDVPYMVHNPKDNENFIATTYDNICGYMDKIVVMGDVALLVTPKHFIFGVSLNDYSDPNQTKKYKELTGYYFGKDGKEVVRCAILPTNIIELKPTMVILLSIENLGFRKFHAFQHATELAITDNSLDNNFWGELAGVIEWYGAKEVLSGITDDSVPVIQKDGKTIKLEIYNLGAYHNADAAPKLDCLSYRAECQADVFKFSNTLVEKGLCHRVTKFLPDLNLGEVLVEMEYWDCTQEEIMKVMQELPDLHVMVGTARPLALEDNTMERDSSK